MGLGWMGWDEKDEYICIKPGEEEVIVVYDGAEQRDLYI